MSKARPVSIVIEPTEETKAKPKPSEQISEGEELAEKEQVVESDDEVVVVVREDVAGTTSERGSMDRTRMASRRSNKSMHFVEHYSISMSEVYTFVHRTIF